MALALLPRVQLSNKELLDMGLNIVNDGFIGVMLDRS